MKNLKNIFKNRYSIVSINILLFILFLQSCTSKKEEIPLPIMVTNNETKSVKVLISNDNKLNWNQTTFSAQETKEFNDEVIYVKIYTKNRGHTLYELNFNNYYFINWNSKEGFWEVIQSTRR